jgi:hypothetical protein
MIGCSSFVPPEVAADDVQFRHGMVIGEAELGDRDGDFDIAAEIVEQRGRMMRLGSAAEQARRNDQTFSQIQLHDVSIASIQRDTRVLLAIRHFSVLFLDCFGTCADFALP